MTERAALELCGAPVRTETAKSNGHETKPLLYRWSVTGSGGEVLMVYVGKARNGLSRPLKTYRRVIQDLRKNRSSKTICQVPDPHYFRRNKWGYRWVHHQLEHFAHAIVCERAGFIIELRIIDANIDPSMLNAKERSAINREKAIFGECVVANDQPCMDKNRSKLAEVWQCGCVARQDSGLSPDQVDLLPSPTD